MSMRMGDGFLQAKWHWMAFGLGVATLAVAIFVWLGEQGVDADGVAAAAISAYAEKSGKAPSGVAAVDLEDYQRAARDVKSPVPLVSLSSREGSFLASERRVHCRFCAGALVPDVQTCPFCGKEQPKDEKKVAVTDRDGDGLPDEWEKKYDLNLDDPVDAQKDADGDLFTNAEEFAAKTDPRNPKDHPEYLDSLTLALPLKQTYMPFYFTGVLKTPSGLKYQFKDPSRGREYDRGVYSILEGEKIGESGFVATKYEELSAKKKMGGGMDKKVDVSVATVTRKSDNKAVRLVVNVRKTPIDVQAKLVFSRGQQTKEFTVVTGDAIDLHGEKYRISSLKALPKGAEITLENAVTGKIRKIGALEQ